MVYEIIINVSYQVLKQEGRVLKYLWPGTYKTKVNNM